MAKMTLLGTGTSSVSTSASIPTPTVDFNPAIACYVDNGVTGCADGDPVRRWNATAPYVASQLTLAKRPVYRVNQFGTKPGLQFYLDDHLAVTGGLESLFNGTNTAVSVFAVINYLTSTATQYFLSLAHLTSTPAQQYRFGTYLGANYVSWRTDNAASQVSLAGSTVAFAPRLLSYVITNASPRADLWVWQSGNVPLSSSSATVSNASFTNGAVTTTGATIGALRYNNTETGWMDAVLGRILVYNRAVTSAERADIENYLIADYL